LASVKQVSISGPFPTVKRKKKQMSKREEEQEEVGHYIFLQFLSAQPTVLNV
jgi:hypothetical protein